MIQEPQSVSGKSSSCVGLNAQGQSFGGRAKHDSRRFAACIHGTTTKTLLSFKQSHQLKTGGDSGIKGTGMPVVSFRGVDY